MCPPLKNSRDGGFTTTTFARSRYWTPPVRIHGGSFSSLAADRCWASSARVAPSPWPPLGLARPVVVLLMSWRAAVSSDKRKWALCVASARTSSPTTPRFIISVAMPAKATRAASTYTALSSKWEGARSFSWVPLYHLSCCAGSVVGTSLGIDTAADTTPRDWRPTPAPSADLPDLMVELTSDLLAGLALGGGGGKSISPTLSTAISSSSVSSSSSWNCAKGSAPIRLCRILRASCLEMMPPCTTASVSVARKTPTVPRLRM
mmetsp:Transcript_31931/g.71651  ORF Transcript_31931/g.71651 Transcript_31931/m.71651 type:complete len:262 (+) Transcript_31931:1070-1855(+)